MKTLIPVTIVILAFFGFAFWVQHSITETANDIADLLSSIEEAAYEENWESAIEDMKAVEDDWNNTRKKWQMLIDHQEIDNIDSTLVRVKSWIALEAKEDCVAELAALKLFILHIPERKALRITNIL